MKPIMFYDGGCPLCRKEVAHYIRMDQENKVNWQDIHANPETLDEYGIDLQTAMQRLHVLDGSGVMQSGAWAFATIWSELPYYHWLAKVVRFFHLLPVIDFAYKRFAKWRYRSRCNDDGCSL